MGETFTKAQTKAMTSFKIFPVTNMNLRELSSVKIPEAAVSFDASNNLLTDFTGFTCTDNVRGVSFDSNPLISFKGFPQNTKITSFSAKGSPLSSLPNFRQLVLIAVGPSVLFINGEKVSNHEKNSVSPETLSNFYHGSGAKKMQDSGKQYIVDKIADSLRRGWISDHFPRHLNTMEMESISQEDDPVTVRAVRIGNLLKWSDNDKLQFISNLFNETQEEKKQVVNSQKDDVSSKIQHQNSIIAIMEQELADLEEEMTKKEEEKEEKKRNEKKESKDALVSQQTMDFYFEMLQNSASELIENSQAVEKNKSIDPEGIRKAIKKFLKLDQNATDEELINGLKQRKQAETQ